jgi:amino acid transporter/mannitol/fructose-specific phosphotransferase system IIA component (Ntr-type)
MGYIVHISSGSASINIDHHSHDMYNEHHMNLKRDLGLFDVFAIAAGAMISSGLFILPGLAFARCGSAAVLAYIIAGIMVFPTAVSMSELVTAMPKAGGDYFYITRSMGFAAGTIAGFASWFSLSLKSAFALLGMGIFASLLFPSLGMMHIKLVAVGFCLIFMVINLLGIKEAGKTQVFLVILLLIILIGYVARGFLSFNPQNLSPFMPHGFLSVLSTAGLVFISFGGLTKIVSVAEEVKKPKVNIPFGMMLAYVSVVILYALVVYITIGVLDHEALSNTLTPISDGARVFWGLPGIIITAIAAVLAFISTANAGIMTASRYPLAMSRDHIMPVFLRKTSKKFKTPYVAIIITTLFMVLTILLLDLYILVEAASTMLLLLYISANLAVIVMRESRLQNYMPSFKAPLYPYIQIVAILGYAFLIFDMGKDTLLITGIFIVICLAWYSMYVRRKISRDSALMFVVERVTDRQIATGSLREELREIVKEREEIIEDEFDTMIKDAQIIDLPDQIHFNEFVKIAADVLDRKLHLGQEKLIELFIEREKQSCTALRPGLAIPHIIIKGKQKFEILLVRAQKGIIFPDAPEPVRIVFALIGSKDMRNFHLRVLMSIAQITEQHGFDANWCKAKSTQDLRDIVLLGKRTRG